MLHEERRRPTLLQKAHQWVGVVLIPLVVIPMVAWILLSVVNAEKEIVSLKLQIVYVQREIQAHSLDSKEASNDIGKIHHTEKIYPCNGCHKK